MMTTRLILATFALGTASMLCAADSTRSTSLRVPSPILAALDSDLDGTLTAAELAAAPMTLAALDRNDDGLVSADEWQAAERRNGRGGYGPLSFTVVFALDANRDGAIQAMEIANAVSSLNRLDVNRDGALTRDELRPVLVARN